MSCAIIATAASGDMQTYQIRTTPTTTSLPQTVVMTSPVTLTSQTSKTDDPQLKREIRLMKNRYVSARGLLWFVSLVCWNVSSKDKSRVSRGSFTDCAISMVCCIQRLQTLEILTKTRSVFRLTQFGGKKLFFPCRLTTVCVTRYCWISCSAPIVVSLSVWFVHDGSAGSLLSYWSES